MLTDTQIRTILIAMNTHRRRRHEQLRWKTRPSYLQTNVSPSEYETLKQVSQIMTPLGFSRWCYRRGNAGFVTCYYGQLEIRVDMSCAYSGRTEVSCDHLRGRALLGLEASERIVIAKLEWRDNVMVLTGGGLTNMGAVLVGR